MPAAYARLAGGDRGWTRAGPDPLRHAADRAAHDRRAPAAHARRRPGRGEASTASSRWALLDRRTGEISGSPNIDRDQLHRVDDQGLARLRLPAPHRRRRRAAGRAGWRRPAPRSGTATTTRRRPLYRAGGGDAVVQRMITMCGLTDTEQSSRSAGGATPRCPPRDAVRLGECVKDGTAAGPKWTAWVLDEMTQVRGTTAAEDQHETTAAAGGASSTACPTRSSRRARRHQERLDADLAPTATGTSTAWRSADDWVLAVMTRYPVEQRPRVRRRRLRATSPSQLVTPKVGAALTMPARRPRGAAASVRRSRLSCSVAGRRRCLGRRSAGRRPAPAARLAAGREGRRRAGSAPTTTAPPHGRAPTDRRRRRPRRPRPRAPGAASRCRCARPRSPIDAVRLVVVGAAGPAHRQDHRLGQHGRRPAPPPR